MIAEALLMATTVWYVPGWMRTEKPREDVMTAMTNAFPDAKIEFKAWDGNRVWPQSVDSADKESWRFAFEVAMMTKEERENLVIVGHSLGGRITARILARLAEHGLKVRQASLMAAAIPNEDPDLMKMGGGSVQPVMAVCNPDDITLRYVYTLAGGEKAVAFGANGTLKPIANVKECVTPSNITKQVKIDADWGKVQVLKDISNHCELFYIDYLRRLLGGEEASGEVLVPQALPTIEGQVMDSGFWWDTLVETNGWKLQRNKVTGHARIIDPGKIRKAWGSVEEMAQSFEKVRDQLIADAP